MIVPGSCYIAVLDPCALAPMPLCDTQLRLAEDPAYDIPTWSAGSLREFRSTLQRMAYSPAQAPRRIVAMGPAFMLEMTNDPKDGHVLAAIVRCGAHAIVTQNGKNFGYESADPSSARSRRRGWKPRPLRSARRWRLCSTNWAASLRAASSCFVSASPQPRNPSFAAEKFARFGNTPASALSGIPNQEASVAPYWSTAVVGIQRPRVSASLGPESSNVGNCP
jgi:hypothetical protein